MSQPTTRQTVNNIEHPPQSDSLDPKAIQYAFSLSAALVGCGDYHELTQTLLKLLVQLPGVQHAATYEVFTQTSAQLEHPQLLFRRFPLSLDDNYQDENTPLLRSALHSSEGGMQVVVWQNEPFVLLDIQNEVNPRRAVLIKGSLSEYHFTILQGLYEVYSFQTALLDRKERDTLTQLLNRQSLDHLMGQILEHFRNKSTATVEPPDAWLAVLDIDYFKKVNDEFGHLFGDEVLIHFANLMKQHFRFSDYLFRFGGEEFLVVLNRISERDALQLLDSFRERVAVHTFPSGQITTSIGVTSISATCNISNLLERADTAVYAAKDRGRNCTLSYASIAANATPKRYGGDDIELF